MSKLICFRVDEEQKARIEAAANTQYKTVTTFVKEKVMSAVENIESRTPKQNKQVSLFDNEGAVATESVDSRPQKQTKRRAAVPTWFRSLCREAARGGSFGFHRVGYRWASNTPLDTPSGFTHAEWQKQVDSMKSSMRISPLAEVNKKWRDALIEDILTWFTRNFPSQMELIPARRRSEFACGFLDAGNDIMRMRSK